jgi:hypothetical protein
MTKHFFFIGASALLLACSNEPKGSSEKAPAEDTAAAAASAYKSYGGAITSDGAMDMTAFTTAIAGKDSLDAKLACEITASCAKKGCWMDVKMADGKTMKVHFKDYAFFVPTSGLEGKQAVIQGRAMKEVTDVATLRHYAEDAGKSKDECEKITAADTSWSFLAEGVLIKE